MDGSEAIAGAVGVAPAGDGNPPAGADHPTRPDLRLLPAAVGCWLTSVVLLGAAPWQCLLTAAAGAALAVALLVRASRAGHTERSGWRIQVAVVVLCVAGAAAGVGFRLVVLRTGPVTELAKRHQWADVELVVTGDPRWREPGPGAAASRRAFAVVPARIEQIRAAGRVVNLRSSVIVFAGSDQWVPLLPSTRVRAVGRLDPSQGTGPVSAVFAARGPPRTVAGPSWVQRRVARWRAGLRQAVADLNPVERALVPALVVGDTAGMPAGLAEDFRTAGMSHLTAVSGANLAIMLAVGLTTVRRLGIRGRAVPLVGVLVIVLFVLVARPQPSVLRAAAMGLVTVLALATGRRRRGLPAMCGAVLALLLIDPWLARSYGFALSVLATGGILLLAPGWRERIAGRVPEPLAGALTVALAAQIACAPVVVLLSGQVSLVAVPANLLAAPAVPVVTVLGMLATLVAPVAMPVAGLLAVPAGLAARWIAMVATRAADFPGAAMPWPATRVGALTLALVSGLLVLLAGPLRRYHAPRLVALVAAAGAVAFLAPPVAIPGLPAAWPPAGVLLVACDVGQGDALVLPVASGSAVVVDTGPDPGGVDRCLRDLGVRRVPLLVLTHFHADHVGGLAGVLRDRTVGEVEVSPLADPPGQAATVRRLAERAGLPVTVGRPGEQRAVGSLSWRALWPVRLLRDEGSAPNNASLVLLAEHAGVRMLLTGDIEPAAQAALVAAEPSLAADVFKVPHHGSSCQDPRLLAAVRPRVALISAGRVNDYGHPSSLTLERLRAAAVPTGRTDQGGDLAVVGTADRLALVARGVVPSPGSPARGASARRSPSGRSPPTGAVSCRR